MAAEMQQQQQQQQQQQEQEDAELQEQAGPWPVEKLMVSFSPESLGLFIATQATQAELKQGVHRTGAWGGSSRHQEAPRRPCEHC